MSDTPNTPETPKKKKNFLIVYVISLLAIALLLLLFSFLQSRRASEQISDLQEEHNVFSTSALQSINSLAGSLPEPGNTLTASPSPRRRTSFAQGTSFSVPC